MSCIKSVSGLNKFMKTTARMSAVETVLDSYYLDFLIDDNNEKHYFTGKV